MGRTLYLNEGSSKLTVTRDGPSVLIKSDEIADRRIPVRLIGRVIIIGSVRLDADIITLFAEHNVPVIFMTRNSEESVVAIPYNHRLARHYEEQKIFMGLLEKVWVIFCIFMSPATIQVSIFNLRYSSSLKP
jgi:CRISPR/Cas system-associated endonuclease Cas1